MKDSGNILKSNREPIIPQLSALYISCSILRSASFSTDVTEIKEDAEDEKEDVPSAEEDLWSTWDKILVKWNSGAVTKSQEVKGLVRRGIPQHLRGITWQMLSGANLCEEKSGYIEYLATDSACEKVTDLIS